MRLPRVLVVFGLLLRCSFGFASPLLSIQSTQVVAGNTAQVAFRLVTDTNLTGLQFDLSFQTNYLQVGSVTGGDSLSDHFLGTNLLAPGLFRVLTISFDNATLTNGTVVYMAFTVATNAPDHDEILTLTNFLGVNSSASAVPLTASNGTLSIVLPPRFIAITPTNGGAIHLELSGTTGRVYAIQATTNLTPPQWTSLTTNTDTNGILLYDDTSAPGFPRRFYRARIEH